MVCTKVVFERDFEIGFLEVGVAVREGLARGCSVIGRKIYSRRPTCSAMSTRSLLRCFWSHDVANAMVVIAEVVT